MSNLNVIGDIVNEMRSASKGKTSTINTPILKVRDNTLLFYNTIYQISNIAEVTTLDLTTEKTFHPCLWILPLVSAFLIYMQTLGKVVIGVLLLLFFIYLLIDHNKTKINEKFGLYIMLNSGTSVTITSKNLEFLQKVAITLHNIMNTKSGSVNFDFSSNTINEIDSSSGSVVNLGTIEGDITTSVK